ncbi:MAG: rhodanese-like domain-containing protein [Anaerolineae bacterium]|nr:rhodanese-like domain-containing protein [Anaerolineae bacterium]
MSKRTRSKKKQTTNPLQDRRIQIGLGAAILIAVIAILVIVLGGGDDNNAKAEYITLDPVAAYERYSASDNAIIVDVRDQFEWESSTGIPVGAVTYSLNDQLRQNLPSEELVPKDKEVFVICNSGNRSQEASQILIDAGYKDVINIAGGIQAWISAGLPTETYTP